MRSFVAAGLLLTLPVVWSTSSDPIVAQNKPVSDEPMEVTSDTPEYCLHLLDRISDLVHMSAVPAPPEVTTLSADGQRLCHHGQLRSGILRLRRALLILQQGGESPRP